MEREIRDSRRVLEDKLREPVVRFSFSQGRTRRAVERCVHRASDVSAVLRARAGTGRSRAAST
ncbi:MAG: hypothetical protein IH800_16185 [Myxococcales bacterium]|nr:hypothetical protein [Myxococcales bacterium]